MIGTTDITKIGNLCVGEITAVWSCWEETWELKLFEGKCYKFSFKKEKRGRPRKRKMNCVNENFCEECDVKMHKTIQAQKYCHLIPTLPE